MTDAASVADTGSMPSVTVATLIADRALDPRLAALLWLLIDGGVPVVVIGPAPAERRSAVAMSLLAIDPAQPWVMLDAAAGAPTVSRLAALLRGGTHLAVVLSADDLQEAMERLGRPPGGLPEDAVRRLGVVVVLSETDVGLRCSVVHYLRPTERDAQGHIQRRPPALLSAWDQATDSYEDYAWAITPELADRVDRAQADFEDRWRERDRFLAEAAAALDRPDDEQARMIARHLAGELPRAPAPSHPAARPSPFHGGLTDPHQH